MLEETIELLTKQMIEDTFKDKNNNQKTILRMSKSDLYKFCIKLIKLVKEVDEMEE